MGIRTDLVMENEKIDFTKLPDGAVLEQEEIGNVKIQRLKIKNLKSSVILGKPMGEYITATVPDFSGNILLENEEKEYMAEIVRGLLPDTKGTVLVVGLGNKYITPDALGPKTSDLVIATRHLTEKALKPLENFRSVAVLSAGVLGQTGIETAEIIKAAADFVKPAAIIAVDAMAAASVSRLGTTIQISNVGIEPGAGVQNKREALNKDTMNIPVIAMGVPTVVDSDTLINEYGKKQEEKTHEPFMVTSRNIDIMIERAGKALSMIINLALQENLTEDDISYLTC